MSPSLLIELTEENLAHGEAELGIGETPSGPDVESGVQDDDNSDKDGSVDLEGFLPVAQNEPECGDLCEGAG